MFLRWRFLHDDRWRDSTFRALVATLSALVTLSVPTLIISTIWTSRASQEKHFDDKSPPVMYEKYSPTSPWLISNDIYKQHLLPLQRFAPNADLSRDDRNRRPCRATRITASHSNIFFGNLFVRLVGPNCLVVQVRTQPLHVF